MLAATENRDLPRITVAARAAGLLMAESASIGLCAWAFGAGTGLMPYANANAIVPPGRSLPIVAMAAGAAVASILAGVVVLRWRDRGLGLLSKIAHRCAPLCVAGIAPFLLNWRIWVGRDLTFLVLAALFALALQATVRVALTTPPLFDLDVSRASLWKRWPFAIVRWRGLPLLIACLAGAFCAAYFGYYTIINHYNIETKAYDLGIETNLVWHAGRGGPLFHSTPLGGSLTHLGQHHTFFAYAMAPLFRLVPRPETLLVLQSIFMGAAEIPLFLIARRRLGPWRACLISCLLALYPPFHGAVLYDFHYQPLSTFFLLMCLQLFEARRNWWAAFVVLLTLSLREDIPALLAVLGAYLVLTGRRPRTGVIVALVSMACFVVQKMIWMPRIWGGASSFIHQWAELLPPGENGFGGVLKTVFANPVFTLNSLLLEDKTAYAFQIFAPLAFVPWRRPIGLLLFVPGLFFTLLETKYPAMISISFQYSAYWTPFVFLAAMDAIAWISRAETRGLVPRASARAWLVAMTFSMVICSYQHGAIFQQNTARAGHDKLTFGRNPAGNARHNDLYALIAQIPPMASVLASEHVVPHVSCRPDAYGLRTGPIQGDYLVVQFPVPDFEKPPVTELLSSGKYGVVDVRDDFALAKRGYKTDRNASVLERVPQ
jgi:uncharacterized membrane protein